MTGKKKEWTKPVVKKLDLSPEEIAAYFPGHAPKAPPERNSR